MSDTFCSLPWIHLATHPHGSITLCCEADHQNRIAESYDIINDQRKFITINNAAYDFNKLANSDNFNQVRLDMIAGKEPLACKKCYLYEKNNLESKRVRESNRLNFDIADAKLITNKSGAITNDVQYQFVELRLGNHCNLACRTCNPMSSSRWVNDWKSLGYEWNFPNSEFDWPLDSKFWQKLSEHSAKIKHIYINGGEPLLIDKHADYLKYLIDNDIAHNVTLQYSTNATVINDLYIDLWKEFKHVEVMISIDDLHERNYYIRYPAKWKDIEKNLNWFLKLKNEKIINPIICQSVSILNTYHLDEFWNYFSDLNLFVIHNYVNYPLHYSITNLPKHTKDILSNKFSEYPFAESFKGFIYSKDENESEIDMFINETEKLDKIRKQNFIDYYPDMAELLK